MLDENMLFIPPCCVDKKLTQAIMQAPHRALSFFTHGDVTMEKFYRAVGYLVDDHHVMVLTMPVIAPDTAAFLLQCFDREWITDLVLSTSRDCTAIIDKYLSPHRQHILYAVATDVTDLSSHLVLYNPTKGLSISGPMYDRAYPSITVAYTMLFQPRHDILSFQSDYGSPLRNILIPDVLRHRKAYRSSLARNISTRLDKFLSLDFPPYQE